MYLQLVGPFAKISPVDDEAGVWLKFEMSLEMRP